MCLSGVLSWCCHCLPFEVFQHSAFGFSIHGAACGTPVPGVFSNLNQPKVLQINKICYWIKNTKLVPTSDPYLSTHLETPLHVAQYSWHSHHSSCIQVLSWSLGPPFPSFPLIQLQGLHLQLSCGGGSQGSVPGYLSTAGCTEQLVPINQEHRSSTHIPELPTCQAAHSSACVTVSISTHSFPGWSYGRTTNPMYFRVQGSTAKILHTCSIWLQEFLYSETQRKSHLSLKIYFHLKTFSSSIEFEPLTPNAMNTT